MYNNGWCFVMSKSLRISLPEKIGKGYKTFWNFKGRYRVCKGSRGSKKSTTTAQNIIYNMMKYPLANTLVVRKVFNTHKDSTWTQLKWATYNLRVSHLWHFSKSPLEATYLPTGQKILFRGLDDPMSITSITVEHGYLCWAWFEEAYQIVDEDAFNKVDMSIRGKLPEGYFKQITLTFNPWSEEHWLKKRFFDVENENILAITTNYMCNEWLGEDDLKLFEQMKKDSPRRYRVEGLGEWGISEGLLYTKFTTYGPGTEIIKPERFEKICCQIDFKDKGTDFFCAIVYGVYKKQAYVLDVYYSDATSAVAEPKIAKMLSENQVRQARVESNGAGDVICRNIKRILREDFNYVCNIDSFHQSVNKESKILSQDMWVMNNLLFPADWDTRWKSFYGAMSMFLANFKENEHDDAPDCCSEIALSFNRTSGMRILKPKGK